MTEDEIDATGAPHSGIRSQPDIEAQIGAIEALASTEDADISFLLGQLGLGIGSVAERNIVRSFRRQIIQCAAAPQCGVLTEEQRIALQRMADHDPRNPSLSWTDNLLLILSAAQVAKDVLASLALSSADRGRE